MRESSGCAARSFHALTEILISPPAASIAACTEGRSKDQKRALIKDITDAVVKNFGVTADAILSKSWKARATTRRRAA
jgi:hypothetical protein